MSRRHDDIDDLGALARRARPVWRLVAVAASVLSAAAGTGFGVAKATARTEAEHVVAPVEKKVDGHLAEMIGKAAVMDAFVEETRRAQCSNAINLYRLCLNARIQCEPVSAVCVNGRGRQ